MSDRDYTVYDVRVTTLSPLHIGTGRELLLEYDYALWDRQTWRLNEDEVLQPHFSDDPAQIARLAQTPPAKLLAPDDFQPEHRFFRYVVKGQPRARTPGSKLREQIKTVDDRPYLPGSSLKGALRTGLAWHGWQARGLRPDRRKLDNRPKFAARLYEQEIFGSDPNHDLMRAIQVSDSAPVGQDRLALLNVTVLMAREEGSPIEVEAVRPETAFRLQIKLDAALFSNWAGGRAGFRLGGAREWVENIPVIAQAHALERIAAQRAWYEKRANGQLPAEFYRDLERLALAENQFVLQLGWGGGWDSKTFGTRITEDSDFLEWLVSTKYRLARGRRRAGDPFPRSRRAAMSVRRDEAGQFVERPARPLGWVLVEMAPAGQLSEASQPAGAAEREPRQRPAARPPVKARAPEAALPTGPPPRPARPAKAKAKPAQPRAPLTASFSELPKPGDRFKGIVFESDADGTIWLDIPGLSSNDIGCAVIRPEGNPDRRKYPEGTEMTCEVIEVTPDPDQPGMWLVICRRQ